MAINDDDLDACFSDDDFGTCATFTLSEGVPLCVNAVFTAASDEILMFGSVAVEAAKPSLMLKTSAIADVTTKITVSVLGNDYIVEKIERSGVGLSTVYLKTKV